MPTAVGPNTYGEENLVFGYDLGDVSNSYKGEPTTNLAPTSVEKTGGNEYLPYCSILDILNTYGEGSGVQFYVSFDAKAAVAGNQYMYTLDGSGRNYSFSGISFSATTEFKRYELPISNVVLQDANGNGNNLSFYGTYGTGRVLTVKNLQIERKTHATPFTPAGTTRSATQGLIDLTGNSTIDLSNVSFDSNAQMVFDGTDDNLDADLQLNYGNFSVEMIASWNSVSDLFCAGSGAAGDGLTGGTNFNAHMTTSGFYVRAYSPPGGPGGWNTSGTVSSPSSTNTTYHITVVNLGTVWYFYKNGTLAGSVDALYTPSSASTRVGIFRNHVQTVGNAGEVFSFKAYNRALTASEVQANYNAIKGRFNI